MKINTYQFGEVEFTEDRILKIPEGLFGFENLKRYLFIKTENDLFYWLNSVDEPEIAFPLVGLKVIDKDYPEMEEFEPFGIVKMSRIPTEITINLKAPIYINQNSKSGVQKIIDNDKYSIDYRLFVEDK
ncbi:MAG: flagellar assembly protein FliW [Ignavibacteriaceae bacterium]|nr:flagellar assembly protein FliW [Ignavibacteriaceae bacterium]